MLSFDAPRHQLPFRMSMPFSHFPATSCKSAPQVGIISWGVGCAKTGFPGVYVRVHEVSSWIQEVCSSWGEPISSPRRDRPPQRHSTTKPTPVTLPTIPPTPTSMAASGTVKPEPRTPQPTQGAHASPPFMAPPPLRAMPPSSPLFVARPTVSPTASPAVPATVYDPLCPPDKWYIVRWKLRIPYDAKLWAATLGSAARLSLSRWLRGVEVNPGLIRIYSLDVSDDDLDVWGRGSSATCQGPTMTAEHW